MNLHHNQSLHPYYNTVNYFDITKILINYKVERINGKKNGIYDNTQLLV